MRSRSALIGILFSTFGSALPAQSRDLRAGLTALGVPLVPGEIVSDGRASWQLFSSSSGRLAIRTDLAVLAGPSEWRSIGRSMACGRAARLVLGGDAELAAAQAQQVGVLGRRVSGMSAPMLSAVTSADNLVSTAAANVGDAAISAAERAGGAVGEAAGLMRSLMGSSGTTARDVGRAIVRQTTGVDIAELRRKLAAVDAAAANASASAEGVTGGMSRLRGALTGNGGACDALPGLSASAGRLAGAARELVAPVRDGVATVRTVASLVPNATVQDGLAILTEFDARIQGVVQPLASLASRSQAAATNIDQESASTIAVGIESTETAMSRAAMQVEREAKSLAVVAPFLGALASRARLVAVETQRAKVSIRSSPTQSLTGLLRAREAADALAASSGPLLARAAGGVAQRARGRNLFGLVSVMPLQAAAQGVQRAQQEQGAPRRVYAALAQLSAAQERFESRRRITVVILVMFALFTVGGVGFVMFKSPQLTGPTTNLERRPLGA